MALRVSECLTFPYDYSLEEAGENGEEGLILSVIVSAFGELPLRERPGQLHHRDSFAAVLLIPQAC